MLLMILIYLLSLVPAVIIFLWLRNRKSEDQEYRNLCNKAILYGIFLATALVLVLSTVLYVGLMGLKLLHVGALIQTLYYDFIIFAFSEEFIKYRVMRGLMKKYPYSYSWLDVTTLMMIVGIGFQLSESLVYAVGANAGMMLVRGMTVMHCAYGFIMGYFVGKGLKTGEKKYTIIGFLISFLLHGTYDFCLSDTMSQISDNFGVIALLLAIVAVVTLVIAILHVRKARTQDKYVKPLDL